MKSLYLKPLFIFFLSLSIFSLKVFCGPYTAKDNNAFSSKVMRSLDQNENQCISSVSIINVIAMLGLGAKGTTKDEINQVLQPGIRFASASDERNMHTGLQQLNGALSDTAKKSNATLDIANALFIGSDDGANTINADFTKAIEKYDGKVFRGSKDEINQWVSNKTHKKISEFLKEDPKSELTLINAVYFKDQWLRKFDPNDTIEGQFHISLSETVKTPLMKQKNQFKFIEESNYKAIKLPFDSLFSLIAVLPDKIDGLQKLATELPHEEDKWKLLEALYADKGQQVDLTFPKFTMESEYDLNRALCNMGMETAFTPRADFTGISPVNIVGGLRIDQFIHKTYISVDEEGVKAAAAAAACVTRGVLSEKEHEFKADHPFQFMTVHDDSKTILFDGLFTKPTD